MLKCNRKMSNFKIQGARPPLPSPSDAHDSTCDILFSRSCFVVSLKHLLKDLFKYSSLTLGFCFSLKCYSNTNKGKPQFLKTLFALCVLLYLMSLETNSYIFDCSTFWKHCTLITLHKCHLINLTQRCRRLSWTKNIVLKSQVDLPFGS